MTLYYKDDVLLKQEVVTKYNCFKMDKRKTLLELLKKTAQKTQEKMKDFIGKGVEIKTDYKDRYFSHLLIHSITQKFGFAKIKRFYTKIESS